MRRERRLPAGLSISGPTWRFVGVRDAGNGENQSQTSRHQRPHVRYRETPCVRSDRARRHVANVEAQAGHGVRRTDALGGRTSPTRPVSRCSTCQGRSPDVPQRLLGAKRKAIRRMSNGLGLTGMDEPGIRRAFPVPFRAGPCRWGPSGTRARSARRRSRPRPDPCG